MNTALTIGWCFLVLLHAPPAAGLVLPRVLDRLYGLRGEGEVALLLRHRAALFLGVVVVCVWAAIDPTVRRLACVVTAISLGVFLGLYARAGLPAGPLRSVALLDLAGLPALALVTAGAFGT